MIRREKIRFQQIGLNYCQEKQYDLGEFAISYDRKIVPIAIDQQKKIITATHKNGKTTYIDLQAKGIFGDSILFHPVVNFHEAGPSSKRVVSLIPRELPIHSSLWQFILDKELQNKQIEFDDSEQIITSITYFNKPLHPLLTQVFKVKVLLKINNQNNTFHYFDEDYSSHEEAEQQLPVFATIPGIDIENEAQHYFTIEKVLKRQEYEKVTYKP